MVRRLQLTFLPSLTVHSRKMLFLHMISNEETGYEIHFCFPECHFFTGNVAWISMSEADCLDLPDN